jgi:ComF family protein
VSSAEKCCCEAVQALFIVIDRVFESEKCGMRDTPYCKDRAAERLQRLLMPPRCILCDDTGQIDPLLDLCVACEQDLPALTNRCDVCAAPLAGPMRVCMSCLAAAPSYERVVSPFRYRWPIDQMLLSFKFGGHMVYGRVLGTLLAKSIIKQAFCADRSAVIVPVPLHWRRHAKRGFNQSQELARRVSRLLRLPLKPGLCRRIAATPAQSGLRADKRRHNVLGAFEVGKHPPTSVLLIDDVMTTGSTCNELAAQFRAAGCGMVRVACVARA